MMIGFDTTYNMGKQSVNSYHGNKKKPKMVFLPKKKKKKKKKKKTLGATDSKLGMHIQIHSRSNIG